MTGAVRPPAADCWLHPDVEVRRSPIEGQGLFAGAAIPAGTVVSRLGGRLVSGDELRRLFADPEQSYVDTITVAADTHLVLPPRRDNGYGNHSCDPNLWWIGPYELAARRDLVPGEELTNDYATSTDDPAFTHALRLPDVAVPRHCHRQRLAARRPAGPVRQPLGAGTTGPISGTFRQEP